MAKKAFVTGFPIKHSRSPLIHGFWLDELGIDGSYEAIEVKPEDFGFFASSLAENGFAGGNVTIPHKEAAYAAVESLDEAAKAIGAVNTLWLENGRLHGGNTDAYGFAANLDASASGWDMPTVLLFWVPVVQAGQSSMRCCRAALRKSPSSIAR